MRNSPASLSSAGSVSSVNNLSSAGITKMILDALPRHTPPPFEMAPNTLRWELGKSQLLHALPRIEKAFGENEWVEDFSLEQGQMSSKQCFIQVIYTRAGK